MAAGHHHGCRLLYACSYQCWPVPQACVTLPVQGYCMRLFEATIGDDWSDGSSEAAFTSKWPLDGSAIAGADLGSLASTMQIRSMLPVALPKDLIR